MTFFLICRSRNVVIKGIKITGTVGVGWIDSCTQHIVIIICWKRPFLIFSVDHLPEQ